jgi:hypothetical protein
VPSIKACSSNDVFSYDLPSEKITQQQHQQSTISQAQKVSATLPGGIQMAISKNNTGITRSKEQKVGRYKA